MMTILQRCLPTLVWRVVAAVVLADIFVAALVAVSLQASYRQYLEQAAVTSSNTNRLVSESIAGEIARIDMALRGVQDEYLRLRTAGRIDQQELTGFLRRQQERLPMVDGLRIADATGNVVFGADKALPAGVSVTDRDYFRALRNNPSKGLVISQPVLGRLSGKWVLIFARSLSRPDGAFDGCVYSPVTIEWFNQKFAKLEVGAKGAVVLRGDASRDFDLLARYPQAGFVGQTKVSPQFTAMITAHPQGGTYEANAGADNIRRTFSYQPVGNYPLITLVGLSTEDSLSEWRRSVIKLVAAAAIFSLLTALGGWLVLRAWNARARAFQEIRALNNELEKDNAARRKAEAEIIRLNAALEQRVQERTAELLLARDAAEAANKAKSVFLANMSHELRTPLNAILGFSSMMRRESQLSESQLENLNIVIRSGEHLLTLINDVLDMSKIEAGRVQLENAPFDLGGMVRDVTDMMEVRAHEKGLQLLIDQTSEFPRYIVGDEARLRQVLINLVGNAVKFTSEGGITVRLGTRQNHHAHLLIEVEDTGLGIAKEDQLRIFESFVQLGEHRDSKGTGLGLTISRQFIEMMGGSISVDSTPGQGSMFRVDLPLKEADESDIIKSESLHKGNVVALAPGQPAFRVLIVEDQLENQLLLRKLIESVGIAVKIAKNGAEAIDVFTQWQPHLIWMDRKMPVMDGLEATRRIRELPGGDTVKIIAVTASAFQDQRAEVMAAGMDDFVRKPYRSQEIYDCLARHLALQFLYENPLDVAPLVQLTSAMFAALPSACCQKLKEALESLETESIAAAIAEISQYDDALAQSLTVLTERFDYPAILKLLQEM